MGIGLRLKNAWDAFSKRDPTKDSELLSGPSSYIYTANNRYRGVSDSKKTIVNSIYNRIGIDAASIPLMEAIVDENGEFVEKCNSELNNRLSFSANLDQTGRSFMQDAIMSMLEEGVVACVPTVASQHPAYASSFDIYEMRVGRITQWYPKSVKVDVYNGEVGRHMEITLPKTNVAIVENPLYSVMNAPNSTLKRLIKKIALSDYIDNEQSGSRLDLVIQLPYTTKAPLRQEQAKKRVKDLEYQLTDSKYGVGYIDATEKITQLNRSVDNQIPEKIQKLTDQLYSELGLIPSVFTGEASEKTMLNYFNRTIEPIVSAFADEFKRKFLTQTAITQRHSIVFFNDPFKLVPVNDLAEIADKVTRNAILSSNEVRALMGFKKVDDPNANALINNNLYNEPIEEYQNEGGIDEL